jgi:Tfp pilus assembly protein PilX
MEARKLMNKQKGVALPIALILFVVMLIGGLYLARSSATASLMAGNLAYQRSLSRAADAGLLAATGWLGSTHEGAAAVKATLDSDQFAKGYVSSFPIGTPQITPADSAFWNHSITVNNVDGNSTNVEYIIYRLCSRSTLPATDTANSCVTTPYTSSSTGGAAIGSSLDNASGQNIDGLPLVHYLITARVSNGLRGVSVINQLVVMMGA